MIWDPAVTLPLDRVTVLWAVEKAPAVTLMEELVAEKVPSVRLRVRDPVVFKVKEKVF